MRVDRHLSISVGSAVVALALLVPTVAIGASRDWHPVASPSPGTGSYLNDVSCPSSIACWGVGVALHSVTSTPRALVEAFHGTRWTVTSVPQPATGPAQLSEISCAGRDFCVAVGSAGSQPWVVAWNGREWRVTTVAQPGSAQALTSVSCKSPSWCMAVGSETGTAGEVPLIEHWNGTTWRVLDSLAEGTLGSSLTGVSCATTSFCEALGVAFDPAVDNAEVTTIFAEGWDGHHWGLQLPPSPNPGGLNGASGIACGAAEACLAVGTTSAEQVPDFGWALRYSGTGWHTMTAPPTSELGDDLNAVACSTASNCYVAGNTGLQSGLVYRWSGRSFSRQVVAGPRSSTFTRLLGIACVVGGDGTAVGLTSATGGRKVVIERNY